MFHKSVIDLRVELPYDPSRQILNFWGRVSWNLEMHVILEEYNFHAK